MFRSYDCHDVTIAHWPPRRVWIAMIVMTILLYCLDVLTPPGVDDGAGYFLLPIITLWLPPERLRDTIIAATMATLLSLVGYLDVVNVGNGLSIRWEIANRILHFAMLWIATCLVYRRRLIILASVRKIENLVHILDANVRDLDANVRALDADAKRQSQSMAELSQKLLHPKGERLMPTHETEAWLKALERFPLERFRRK
jgi:hypothetical protein